MTRNYEHYLADDVTASISEDHHRYEMPRRDEHRAFELLGQAVRMFDEYARETDIQERESAYVGVVRRLSSLFGLAYETDIETDPRTYNPTVEEFERVLYQAREKPALTFTVEKTGDSLVLEYTHGFTYDEYDNGLEERLLISNTREDPIAGQIVRACCRGIEDDHTPRGFSRPPVLESWRNKRPSKTQLSIRETNDGVELGVSNQFPKKPLSYYPFSWLKGTGYPHAHATLTLEKQDSPKVPTVNTGWLNL